MKLVGASFLLETEFRCRVSVNSVVDGAPHGGQNLHSTFAICLIPDLTRATSENSSADLIATLIKLPEFVCNSRWLDGVSVPHRVPLMFKARFPNKQWRLTLKGKSIASMVAFPNP